MRPGVLEALAAAWLGALWATPLSAAPPDVPHEISYQGVLLDGQGALRTGTVDLTLRIHDSLTGGTLVYKQDFTTVALSDGVFTIQLGPTGAATDVPVDPLTTSLVDALAGDLARTGPSRFLEVTVGTESPLSRTQILSAPYALQSENALLAESALDAQNVNGLDSLFVTEIFEHFAFDGSDPPNDDPSEGLGDTDLDGLANFVDPDNDDDGLSDGAELAQGSDINLVTPVVSSVSPAHALYIVTTRVQVDGANFDPGQAVVFGSQSPPPLNVNPTSFEVDVGPQALGFVDVEVMLPNGEQDSLTGALEFQNFVSHSVSTNSGTQVSLAVLGTAQTAISGLDEYQVDVDGNGAPETPFPFASDQATGQIAVGFDPAGDLVGVRCATGDPCSLEVAVDSDGDFDLADETPTVVALLTGSGHRLFAASLAFDSAGGLVSGQFRQDSGVRSAVVVHDRDANGLFDGTNEQVTVETGLGLGNHAEAAVDASDRVAFAYYDGIDQAVDVAWDRSGDGDYDDTVGGNPELFSLSTGVNAVDCLGAGFAPDGDLAVVYDDGSGPTFARDQNADGDFADAGEVLSLAASGADGCDAQGGGGVPLAVAYAVGGTLTLLVDRNDDGDFGDSDENVSLASGLGSIGKLTIARNPAGRIFVATTGPDLIWVDPTP